MSETDISKSLRESSKAELIVWKVELRKQINEAQGLLARIDREIKKR